jgi:hypothetical protein
MLAVLPSCSFRSFQRETDTTGTFRTKAIGVSFLLHLIELPWNPRLRAMELARDTWGDNLRVVRHTSFPDLGPFNFLNGLLFGVHSSIVLGEYGVPPDTEASREELTRAQRSRRAYRNPDGSPVTPGEGVDR